MPIAGAAAIVGTGSEGVIVASARRFLAGFAGDDECDEADAPDSESESDDACRLFFFIWQYLSQRCPSARVASALGRPVTLLVGL